MSLNPRHKQIYDSLLFRFRQFSVLRHLIPFVQTSSAAAGSGMHCLEHRVAVHRRLLPVIHRVCRSQLLVDKVLSMLPYGDRPFFLQVHPFRFRQMKAGTEF